MAHIITKDKKQALKIIDILMGEKLLLHAVVSEKTVYQKIGDKLQESQQTLIIGKTKALLFNTINEEIKKHFSENMPMLYSIPIVYMDDELTDLIRSETAKV
ncbi:divalent cation tolerance protein CutA [Costertonia aggregata]|uniref:Divalent cation tolerance protein CutA n=1 Tax=Costertonia aggregata TaxID=343403 RepID=A0A7H9AQH3_9FLAO|nr:divalent cation tolerance protein CutA [Costertonia aggregata]QLG45659.1 divalent cation tolerance protein CutA [Costertonia aggregata]